MTELYSPAEVKRVHTKAVLALAMAIALLTAALIVCVRCCSRVRPSTTVRLMLQAIAAFTFAGWVALLLINLVYIPGHAQEKYLQRLAQTEETRLNGVWHLEAERVAIPHSISVLKVSLVSGESLVRLNLDEAKRHFAPPDGTRVELLCKGSYIVGIGASHEQA